MTYLSKSHLFVDAMKEDIKYERLKPGITTEGKGVDFKGCWIGCAIREYNHDKMAKKLNWPLSLVKISERIFEGLEDKSAEQAFAVDVLAAPKPNADMSLAHWKFLHWMVKDTLEKYADRKTQKACALSVQVLLDKSKGLEVSKVTTANAINAANAANAINATYAANAAAYATYATNSSYVTDSTAYATAYAANAAANAAAYAARYKDFANKLLEIMREQS